MGDAGVGVDAAVAKEGPVATDVFQTVEVHAGDQRLFLVGGASGEFDAERIGDERGTPELDAGAADGSFATDTIDGADVDTVGNGVGALDRAPSLALLDAGEFLFVRVPADRGGIENHNRAGQCGQARAFGIPLVPADEHGDAAVAGVESAEAEIAGSEIKLFVIQGIVRDVHLAVQAEEFAGGVNNGGAVVVNAGGTTFEDRSDDDDLMPAGDGGKGFGGRARDGLGKIEQLRVFLLAEILGTEELREADDLGAARGCLLDTRDGMGKIAIGLGNAGHLHEADGKRLRRIHERDCTGDDLLPPVCSAGRAERGAMAGRGVVVRCRVAGVSCSAASAGALDGAQL